MRSKPGELVPIGDAVPGLDDGPAQEFRESSPQARHHFTQADQVNRLVAASETDPDMGFMARTMALCSLPRRDPGNRKEYVRRNGPYTLVMSAGGLNKLPFGNLPRLLMAWLCSEVVRTGSREVVLGKSLADFMRKLDVYSTSGEKYNRLREQIKRLFGCTVSLIYSKGKREATASTLIADHTDFWWTNDDDQQGGGLSKIRVSEAFFNEVMSHPVPLDMNTLTALKRSSLGLDLYLWLTYRVFVLRGPQRLTWRQLYRQFGANPDKASDKFTVRDFRRKVLRELKKIKVAWPELNYSTALGVLILYPCRPQIDSR